jgi:hypothetical protein
MVMDMFNWYREFVLLASYVSRKGNPGFESAVTEQARDWMLAGLHGWDRRDAPTPTRNRVDPLDCDYCKLCYSDPLGWQWVNIHGNPTSSWWYP